MPVFTSCSSADPERTFKKCRIEGLPAANSTGAWRMQAQNVAVSKRSDLVESEAAGRVAEMEEQMDRQRRALRQAKSAGLSHIEPSSHSLSLIVLSQGEHTPPPPPPPSLPGAIADAHEKALRCGQSDIPQGEAPLCPMALQIHMRTVCSMDIQTVLEERAPSIPWHRRFTCKGCAVWTVRHNSVLLMRPPATSLLCLAHAFGQEESVGLKAEHFPS